MRLSKATYQGEVQLRKVKSPVCDQRQFKTAQLQSEYLMQVSARLCNMVANRKCWSLCQGGQSCVNPGRGWREGRASQPSQRQLPLATPRASVDHGDGRDDVLLHCVLSQPCQWAQRSLQSVALAAGADRGVGGDYIRCAALSAMPASMPIASCNGWLSAGFRLPPLPQAVAALTVTMSCALCPQPLCPGLSAGCHSLPFLKR